MLVFLPAASIARQPSAVRHPRQKECDWRIGVHGIVTRRVSEGRLACLAPRLGFGFSVLSLAYASGYLSCPSLTLRSSLNRLRLKFFDDVGAVAVSWSVDA